MYGGVKFTSYRLSYRIFKDICENTNDAVYLYIVVIPVVAFMYNVFIYYEFTVIEFPNYNFPFVVVKAKVKDELAFHL